MTVERDAHVQSIGTPGLPAMLGAPARSAGEGRSISWNETGPEEVVKGVELLVGLAVLVLFDIAAWRWGVDSAPHIEQDLTRVITARPTRSM